MQILGRFFFLALLLATTAACFADDAVGTVEAPVASLPGACRVKFPTTVTPRVRDVFRVMRAGAPRGEAIVIEVQGQSAVLMPKAGFNGTMARGDTAAFVRHAVDAAQIPERGASSGPLYRAFSTAPRIKLIDPVPKEDMVFETSAVRLVVDLTGRGFITLDLHNLSKDAMKIDWSNSNCTDCTGDVLAAIPADESSGTFGNPQIPTVILSQDTTRLVVVPVGMHAGRPTIASLLNAPLDEGPKTFKLKLHVDAGPLGYNWELTFEASLAPRNVYLGMQTRGATETEKDDLVKYRYVLVVTNVMPNSPAWQAGLQIGDSIVSCDNEPVVSTVELTSRINKKNAGDTIVFTIVRKSLTLNVPVKLGAVR